MEWFVLITNDSLDIENNAMYNSRKGSII